MIGQGNDVPLIQATVYPKSPDHGDDDGDDDDDHDAVMTTTFVRKIFKK